MSNNPYNRRSSYLCLMLILFSAVELSACGNMYYGQSEKHVHRDNPVEAIQAAAKERAYWQAKERELRARINDGFKYRSDYAVTLMHLGQAADAIEILRRIEAEHPGHYAVAANLGTAYELTGQNEKALVWIKEGIVRNAHSHRGTEWLHVRILEAKIKLRQDPNWLARNSVTGLDFGGQTSLESPRQLSVDGGDYVDSFRRALIYQLSERVQFVAAPDAIVANLLFDLGNVLSSRGHAGAAASSYEYSLTYSPHNEALVRARLEAAQAAVGIDRSPALRSTAPISFADLSTFIADLSTVGQLLFSLAIAAFVLLIVTAIGMPLLRRRKQSQAAG